MVKRLLLTFVVLQASLYAAASSSEKAMPFGGKTAGISKELSLARLRMRKKSHNKLKQVDKLLKDGVTPNLNISGSRKIQLPLISAVKQQNIELIYQLLQAGADPNVGGTKEVPFAPLHLVAMQKGSFDKQMGCANLLIAHGADIAKKSYDGRNARKIAFCNHNHKFAGFLGFKLCEQKAREKEREQAFVKAFLEKDYKTATALILERPHRSKPNFEYI